MWGTCGQNQLHLVMAKQRIPPEVNAGSMADIAFLLLIFFLVTASIVDDKGFKRDLPPIEEQPFKTVAKRNLLKIAINDNNELLLNDNRIELTDIRGQLIAFIDNGGGPPDRPGHCEYCRGQRSNALSDNPQKAIVYISATRNSSFSFYVTVYDEIMAAYNFLRNREALQHYGEDYHSLLAAFAAPESSAEMKTSIKKKIGQIRNRFPQNIVESKQNTKP